MTSIHSANPILAVCPVLLPTPKEVRYTGCFALEGGNAVIETTGARDLLSETAARQLEDWLREHWNGPVQRLDATHSPAAGASEASQAGTSTADSSVTETETETETDPANQPSFAYRFQLSVTEEGGESYSLKAGRNGTVIQGSPHGVLYGVRTLVQLMTALQQQGGGLVLPLAEIEDEPDLPVRGIFAECHWGSDLMKLEDWLSMVDEMAALKLNTLSIGIYGCWYPRYPTETNSLSEFLFAPVLPEEQWPRQRHIQYFDPQSRTLRTFEYEPALLAEGALERLVAYARERGIRVVPQFNGPGHSLLIPRLYPHLSATNKAGQPTGEGYTLTHPETLPLLQATMGEIVERYMKPHGQTWFHIGMDEISRWSEADLARHSPRELLELYLTEIGGHLLRLGMEKIVLWHDMAESLTGFDDSFEELLERCGLAGKVIVQWWCYTDPLLRAKRVRGAESWVAPSTGYLAGMYYEDYIDNIEQMVNEGVRVGASGVVAYALYSPTHRRNTAFLAEKGWNTRKTAPESFEHRYALQFGGEHGADERAEAMRLMRQLFQYSPASMLLREIAVFGGNRHGYKKYPARVIESILAQPGTYQAYKAIRVTALRALRLWEQAADGKDAGGTDAELGWSRFECRRAAGLVEAMLALADAVRSYREMGRDASRPLTIGLAEAAAKLRSARDGLDALLLDMWHTLPRCYALVACREYAALREAMHAQLEQLEQLRDQAEAAAVPGTRIKLPEAVIMCDSE